MLPLPPSLLDTDTLSEFIRGRNPLIAQKGRLYLQQHGRFTFSVITRYEILKGLKAKAPLLKSLLLRTAAAKALSCRSRMPSSCRQPKFTPTFYRRGQLILDADILIAAAALERGLVLVTNNLAHFQRILNLKVTSWAV